VNFNGGRKGRLEELNDLLNNRAKIQREPLGLIVGATEGKDLPDKILRPEAGRNCLFEMLPGCFIFRQLHLYQPDISHNDGQNVVEVVRNTSGESSDCLQALRLPELSFSPQLLIFRPLALGNLFATAKQAMRWRIAAVLDNS